MRKSEALSTILAYITFAAGLYLVIARMANFTDVEMGICSVLAIVGASGVSKWVQGFSESLFTDIFKENK